MHIKFGTLTYFGLAHLSILSRLQVCSTLSLAPIALLHTDNELQLCVCVRGRAKRVIKGGAAESWNLSEVHAISMHWCDGHYHFVVYYYRVQLQACDQSNTCKSLVVTQTGTAKLSFPFAPHWLESLHASAEVPKASWSFSCSVVNRRNVFCSNDVGTLASVYQK